MAPDASPTAAGRQTEPEEFVPRDYFRRLEKGEIFGDAGRPLEVDLGCGDGTFLIERASAYPGRDFLGVERLLGRVRKVCRKARRAGVSNVQTLRLETGYTVEWLLPDGAVRCFHLLFPDPWPKKRHHKRRLVTPRFCAAVHRALEPGGEWFFKSDHAEYFDDACETIAATRLFRDAPWAGSENTGVAYPATDFERQWVEEGRAIQAARFVPSR